MAAAPDPKYFPGLAGCLDQHEVLISWHRAYTALLSDNLSEKQGLRLDEFLLCPDAQNVLQNPNAPFKAPTSASRQLFDSFIAPTNVANSPARSYNLSEIKDDALWLSEEVKIDELHSLRVVLLEYQSRAETQLLRYFTSDEQTSLQSLLVSSTNNTATLLTQISTTRARAAGTPGSERTSPTNRRARIIEMYLDERSYAMRSTLLLLQIATRERTAAAASTPRDVTDTDFWPATSNVISRVAAGLLGTLFVNPEARYTLFSACVSTLDHSTQDLQTGCSWMRNTDVEEAIDSSWTASRLTEMTVIMEVIACELHFKDHMVRPASIVMSWFAFAASVAFFTDSAIPLAGASDSVESLQSMTAVITLALLSPRRCGYLVDGHDTCSTTSENQRSFLEDMEAVASIHSILTTAAIARSAIAMPAVLGWIVILQATAQARDAREQRLLELESRRAADTVQGALQRDMLTENDVDILPGQGQQLAHQDSTDMEKSLEREHHLLMQIHGVVDASERTSIGELATLAIDECNVFDVLGVLATAGASLSEQTHRDTRVLSLYLIKASANLVNYSAELAQAVSTILSADSDVSDDEQTRRFDIEKTPIAYFCEDEQLREFVYGNACLRFPYESLPFLQFSQKIAHWQYSPSPDCIPALMTYLETLSSITYALPADFRDYELLNEAQNSNEVALTRPAPLFSDRHRKTPGSALMELDDLTVPAGTNGRIVSESEPKVAIWYHKMAGLRYIGKLLETALTSKDIVSTIGLETPDRDCLEEVVHLLSTLISSCVAMERRATKQTKEAKAALTMTHHILQEASSGLSRNRDIISIVFSLFEEELLRQAGGSKETIGLLIRCSQFITIMIAVLPGRVWPLLSRCGLLEIHENGGKLTTILTSVELSSGRYDFTISCLEIYSALITDAVANASVRKWKLGATNRFDNRDDFGTGVPTHVLSAVLHSFTRVVIEIYITACDWNYAEPSQRLVISTLASSSLKDVIQYSCGIDDLADPSTKLTSSMKKSSDYATDLFFSSTSGQLTFQPVLRTLLDGIATPEVSINAKNSLSWRVHIISNLALVTMLVRLSTVLQKVDTQLQDLLFKASALIVRLYAVHQDYKIPVIKLLDALVVCAAQSEHEPASLLGYMGSDTARNFLALLVDLGQPLIDSEREIAIWRLLAAIVSSRQQWFATFLLTGRSPRGNKETGMKEQPTFRSLLEIGCESLMKLESLDKAVAIAMLEFVSSAQNHWPWAVGDLQKNSALIKFLMQYASRLQKPPVNERSSIDACHQARIAALIAEVLAMNLYHRRQLGEVDRDVMTYIGYYARSAASPPSFNSSLYNSLKNNMSNKFPGMELQSFKRTDLMSRQFGSNFYYDINIASGMLSSHRAWTGEQGKDNGFRAELERVNINLSVVEAEMTLLQGWKMLVIELSNVNTLNKDEPRQRVLVNAVCSCLNANAESQISEEFFAKLNQTRADLALTLMRRLVASRSVIPEMKEVLGLTWSALQFFNVSLESILLVGVTADLEYYRVLLKLLFVSLGAHKSSNGRTGIQSPPTTDAGTAQRKPPNDAANNTNTNKAKEISADNVRQLLVLELITQIIYPDFHAITRALHDYPALIAPEDLAILTGILQVALSIPGMETHHAQLVTITNNAQIIRAATTLFSWADKLAISGDPVYGELSMHFLLELSSVPALAEQLAIDGVLGYIAAASITSYLRSATVSPFADGTGPQRCYAIWASGILPLVLNILASVEAAIAAEVALFLNQFPKLLQASVAAIDTPSATAPTSNSLTTSTTTLTSIASPAKEPKYISLATIRELSNLALISVLLIRVRETESSFGVVPKLEWDGVEVKESVEWWLASRHVLRERIVPLGAGEVGLTRMAPIDPTGGAKDRLEEIVVQELECVREILGGGAQE